jgi:hypothetical protein
MIPGAEVCGYQLTNDRTCCHTQGHSGKHSHTWQTGDARYLTIDEKLIDMETGEVVGYTGGLAKRVIEEIVDGRIDAELPKREDTQARALRTLQVQYGYKGSADDNHHPCYASPPTGYSWHYEGVYRALGTDSGGHDVEFEFSSGKLSRIYSINQRRDAVNYARRYGTAKAAAKYDIPAATIRSWNYRKRATARRAFTHVKPRVMTVGS